MKLDPEGLYVLERAEDLTPGLFRELVSGGTPFTLAIDYRGLPPPLEELDRVHLVPAAPAALPPGALVLASNGQDIEIFRVPSRPPAHFGEHVALAVRVERPGARIRLDSLRWRLLGRLFVTLPGLPAVYAAGRRALTILGKLARPLPIPLHLGTADDLVAGVVNKYAHPEDVREQIVNGAAGLEPWEEQVISRAIRPPGPILVLGSGAGREALALAERGFDVVGVDLVPALVSAARAAAATQGLTVTFHVGPVDALDLAAGSFPAILCPCSVYEHTPTRARRIAFLESLARLLTPTGVLILVVGWSPYQGRRLALVDVLRRGLRAALGESVASEPGDRLLRHVSIASDRDVTCFYHVFPSPDDVEAEVTDAGLVPERIEGGLWLVRKSR